MLKHKGTQQIETERLLLRAVKAEDYKDMYLYMSREEMARYVTWQRHESEEVTKELCKMWANQYSDDRYNWAITLDGKAVGNIEVVKILDKTAYLGYQISSDYWNKGMVTEALKAVLKYLFEEIGFEKCEACHVESNPASGRVMEKAGMKEIHCTESDEYKANNKTELNGMKIIFKNITKKEWENQNEISTDIR